ncbi:glycoside hydrolase family 43 protein [Salibacterium halotolerans]|uniref:Xylan 1,4-beta-xylosidase n=1 Tax=Salibacterium halotolerans TaxID=1884432 RepID=A0A1I5L205_9BACI|nr:glycoside hydrolase family 43 protein [Salibacterium halotolerans]SFO91364.1 xylan 1,4-beta-xylosidase [Salibacterium halotolerans]
MRAIENPILTGFHPDPSIMRVGDDYYMATSTFEWFPGVELYHSRDLRHWEMLPSPLNRSSQLDMIGNCDSGGVWAPCLSYSDGLFYLIYTDMKSRHGAYKDSHNYLVTTADIEGPWSDPVYLNSSGFDPSLYHEEDGTKWLLNMLWDYRAGNHSFAGIVIQEYSQVEQKLIGPVKTIFRGTSIGVTEAPHLYKQNGYYYLVTAEGGTEYEHAVTIARSRSLFGPYEVDPANPVLTSKDTDAYLQKAGHGSLVQTQDGTWYLAHLCGRPVKKERCILGRETALQKCYWTEDDWIRVEGGSRPQTSIEVPDFPVFYPRTEGNKDDFTGEYLKKYWKSLRRPFTEEWISWTERAGYLRLKGGESLNSLHRQSLMARRLNCLETEVETCLDFHPVTFQQMAGLIFYYDTTDHVYLFVGHDEEKGRCVGVLRTIYGVYEEPTMRISIPDEGEVCLKGVLEQEWLQLYYSVDRGAWQTAGDSMDISHLSDDTADDVRFTGTFTGICSQDLSGAKLAADFRYFDYRT